MARALRQAGFRDLKASFTVPKRIADVKSFPSRAYMLHLCLLEKSLGMIPNARLRSKAANAARLLKFTSGIVIAATK